MYAGVKRILPSSVACPIMSVTREDTANKPSTATVCQNLILSEQAGFNATHADAKRSPFWSAYPTAGGSHRRAILRRW